MVTEYQEDIQKIVNAGKLGRYTHQNQWTFPINKGKDGVASDFSLKGEFGWTILSRSHDIIKTLLKYHTQKEQDEWSNVLNLYDQVLKFINRRTHFTDADIREFQKLADEYGAKWREVAGRDGQTNYEHFIWSGHLSYYLYKYGNLYMFSQQGFEAMMSRVKCIYHKCA